MLIIIDKITKKIIENHGTNNLYPCGNIPNIELKDNEETVRIHDDSELAQEILSAYDYELVIGENGIEGVKVNKTLDQFRREFNISPAFLMSEIKKELSELDLIVPRIIEDIISQANITIPQSKLDVIARKQELRQQLQNL